MKSFRMVDLIIEKREGKELSQEKIEWIVQGITDNTLPDYQLSAWAMAVLLKGMTPLESSSLAMSMARSGDQMDLSFLSGVTLDKHSTGGVGDKVSLILAPLLASFGIPIAKLSGRGLGHTGGTVDKLESLAGFRTTLSDQEFLDQIEDIGVVLAGQTKSLAPADKRMYSLRDVTGTVESIPLIASSIMSKKLAGGAETILLDVKVGSGSFLKSLEEAEELAKLMTGIGNHQGRRTIALLSRMDEPLGLSVGNTLEVQEAIEILHGKGEAGITTVINELAVLALELTKIEEDREKALRLIKRKIDSKEAYQKFLDFIHAQGAEKNSIEKLNDPSIQKSELLSPTEGYITEIDALAVGKFAMKLGAGRERIEDTIDPHVGVVLNKKRGESVQKGESLMTIYHRNRGGKTQELLEAYQFQPEPFTPPSILYRVIE